MIVDGVLRLSTHGSMDIRRYRTQQRSPPTTPVTSDLAEVLVFSMVDMRRAKASTTRRPEPVESSFAVVNSYSSGSTPEIGREQVYKCVKPRQPERTASSMQTTISRCPSDPSCTEGDARGHKHHNTLSWVAGGSSRRRLQRDLQRGGGLHKEAGRKKQGRKATERSGDAPTWLPLLTARVVPDVGWRLCGGALCWVALCQHILNSRHHIAEGRPVLLTWDRGGAAWARVLNGAKEIQV